MGSSFSSKTHDEILSQPDVWRSILTVGETQFDKVKLNKLQLERIILTGCGTTFALSLSAASFFRHYGIVAEAYPASELAFYPELLLDRAGLLIAFSRSGMTSETLWAVKAFRKQCPDGKVCAFTTQAGSTLAGMADIVLDASPAGEQSIAETRSFTGMLLLAQLFAANLHGDSLFRLRAQVLPQALEVNIPAFSELSRKIAYDLRPNRFFFLGSGPLYGIACEAAFKIKEFVSGWGEAFHPLEFRHGPMTAVGSDALVVGLLSDRRIDEELKILKEMKAKGGYTLAMLDQRGTIDLDDLVHTIELSSGLVEFERAILYLPIIQLIAYHRSVSVGLDPDNPQNLKAVTLL